MATICVVDDKEILRESVAATLTREDHQVTTFADPAAALEAIRQSRFELVLTDLKMPGMDGLALVRELRASGCDVPVIMMTAYATVGTAVEAMRIGAYDYIQKPFEADALVALVERALEHARLRRENEAWRVSVQDWCPSRELIGSSATMQRLRAQLDRVAAGQGTVLITGESGTGKELVASYIHRRSPRADRPMLCVNCAALSSNLLESEIFGHERGSFTGADRTRKGRFELADGGTLLLDEISELAVSLQAKLLRVLQEGQFERVGSSTTRQANVRIIATSNRDLREWIEKRRFREDLYYRLNVLPVQVPPLRDRIEDIPELAEHFIAQAVRQNGVHAPRVADATLRILRQYSWPGNVRELENLCHRAVTLAPNGTITPDLVEGWLGGGVRTAPGLGTLREGRMLEDMERQLIERTLAQFNGHRAKSAKALGMGVRTLGMKLKQWREESEQHQRTQEAVEVGV